MHIGIAVISILLAINHIIIVRPRVAINLALKIIGASPTLASRLVQALHSQISTRLNMDSLSICKRLKSYRGV